MTANKPDPLDKYFQAARSTAPEPSQALLSLIETDALREVEANAPAYQNDSRIRYFDVFRSIGGWPVWSGIATASLVGLWVGASGAPGLDPLELVDAYRLDAYALYDEYGDFALVAE